MSQSEQKGADQLTQLGNMYLGGGLGECLISQLPLRPVKIVILPDFGSFCLKPIFTGDQQSSIGVQTIDHCGVQHP